MNMSLIAFIIIITQYKSLCRAFALAYTGVLTLNTLNPVVNFNNELVT